MDEIIEGIDRVERRVLLMLAARHAGRGAEFVEGYKHGLEVLRSVCEEERETILGRVPAKVRAQYRKASVERFEDWAREDRAVTCIMASASGPAPKPPTGLHPKGAESGTAYVDGAAQPLSPSAFK